MTHMNITLEQVKKDYSRRTIVEDVNLEIKEGETVVLSGHNGTGKSTLLRIIGGLTTPTEGSVRYQEKYKIGYVPEHFRPTDMSARKYFWHVGQIEGLSPQAVRKRSDMLMDLFFYAGHGRYSDEAYVKRNPAEGGGYPVNLVTSGSSAAG